MHQRSSRRHWFTAAQMGGICALGLGWLSATYAGPMVVYDGSQQTGASTYTSDAQKTPTELLPMDDTPTWPATKGTAPTPSEPTQTSNRTSPPTPAGSLAHTSAAPIATQANATDANGSIHSAIKEGVRPVYEQLVESGAVEALHDLKADLGLNKNQWSDHEKPGAAVNAPGRWDTTSGQDPVPKTEAQAKWDRELATTMREKLVEQITPWVIGLVGLYVAGYLGRLLYRYMSKMSARRSARRIARAQRHASRRTHSRSHG